MDYYLSEIVMDPLCGVYFFKLYCIMANTLPLGRVPDMCEANNCQNKATHGISVELRVHKNHPPATSTVIVYVCKDHTNTSFDEIVPPASFEYFGDVFEKMGKMRPVRKNCNLVVTPISTSKQVEGN